MVIAFLLSPIGRIIAGIVALIVALGGVWMHGNHTGSKRVQTKWEAANVAAAIKAAKADNDAAWAAAELDKNNTKEESDADKAINAARDAYIKELESRANRACTLDDADLGRLQDIR